MRIDSGIKEFKVIGREKNVNFILVCHVFGINIVRN